MPAWIRFAVDNLGEGERILYQTRKHWIVVVPSAIVAFACLVGLMAIPITPWETLKEAPVETVLEAPWQTLISALIPIAIISGVSLIAQILNVITTEITITNQRVIWKTGFIWRSTGEIVRKVIEGSNVQQSIFGRTLGYGTVFVNGIGTQRLALKTIIKPLKFRRKLNATIRSAEKPPQRPQRSKESVHSKAV